MILLFYYLQKAAARKQVLHLSSSIDQPTKDKLLAILLPDFMAFTKTSTELDSDSGSSNENNIPLPNTQNSQRKKLWYHQLMWRSTELESHIKSLDHKLEHRHSMKAKRMMIPVRKDGPPQFSNRHPPAGVPCRLGYKPVLWAKWPSSTGKHCKELRIVSFFCYSLYCNKKKQN